MLQGPGENAGVIDLGDGEAVCFKVESHNHPSAVEPFQGAATGVGGILRDIIAMGARPIALLDGLRFAPGDPRFDRAVAGIGAYGNSVGVPTVGGEAVFDESYRGQRARERDVRRAAARRPASRGPARPAPATSSSSTARRPAATGSAARRCSRARSSARTTPTSGPTVQVGDPFTGKKLIEVSVELVESGLVESLQDCGAAGSRVLALGDGARHAGSTSGSTACRSARRGWSRGR